MRRWQTPPQERIDYRRTSIPYGQKHFFKIIVVVVDERGVHADLFGDGLNCDAIAAVSREERFGSVKDRARGGFPSRRLSPGRVQLGRRPFFLQTERTVRSRR